MTPESLRPAIPSVDEIERLQAMTSKRIAYLRDESFSEPGVTGEWLRECLDEIELLQDALKPTLELLTLQAHADPPACNCRWCKTLARLRAIVDATKDQADP